MDYPHSSYAGAVYDALTAAGITPDGKSATANAHDVLLIHITWNAGHASLDAAQWPNGMRIVWRSNFGWLLDDPTSLISAIPSVPHLAAPGDLANLAVAAAKVGMYTNNMVNDLPGSYAEWAQADELAAALERWDTAGART